MNKLVIVFIVAMMCLPAFASDLAKEKRWETQVVDALMDGDELYIESEGIEFLAIEMPSESDNSVGAIVVHGMGVHPNWEQVVQPVRIGLAESGLYTLSIQMPVLANDAAGKDYESLLPQAASRLDSAIGYLKEQGMNKIVIVAHSLGTEMVSYYLSGAAGQIDDAVVGFVAVSMLDTSPDYLGSISLPVLDIYGTDDDPRALDSVPKRKAASLHNEHFVQVLVSGANHFFDGREVALVDEIKQFIAGLN